MIIMYQRKRALIYIFLIGICVSNLKCIPRLRAIEHDPSLASDQAIKLCKIAFIERNTEKSYSMLSDNMRDQISLEKYKDLVSAMHPQAYPLIVQASEYELVPGQTRINIYANGENETERFYYLLVMEGTIETGYQVGGILRGKTPFPSSKLKKPFSIVYLPSIGKLLSLIGRKHYVQ